MRNLDISNRNRLVLEDPRAGVHIELYYRNPSLLEEISYQSRLSEGSEIDITKVRLNFGLNILTGFREGDFKLNDRLISSNKRSPNYCKDWKNLLRITGPDLVRTAAAAIFENSRPISSGANQMVIWDARSASAIEFHRRILKPEEEKINQIKIGRSKGKSMVIACLYFGLQNLLGFREGDFGLGGKPISSDEKSSYFYKRWKPLLKLMASDLIVIFAAEILQEKRLMPRTQKQLWPFKSEGMSFLGDKTFSVSENPILKEYLPNQ